MHAIDPYADLVPVPRAAVELPLPLPVPAGFDPERMETWPNVEGSLEWVAGRLLYMPPSADYQQDTCSDVAGVLTAWRKRHRNFVVGTNEAGIRLRGETRGADAAVWRRADATEYQGELRKTPPVLVVEVAGKYDTEDKLREKAGWYLTRGAEVVWLLFPTAFRALVVTGTGERSFGLDDRLPPHASLPELEPPVGELFQQVSEAQAR